MHYLLRPSKMLWSPPPEESSWSSRWLRCMSSGRLGPPPGAWSWWHQQGSPAKRLVCLVCHKTHNEAVLLCTDSHILTAASRRAGNGYTFMVRCDKSTVYKVWLLMEGGNSSYCPLYCFSTIQTARWIVWTLTHVGYLRWRRQWAAAALPAFRLRLPASPWCGHKQESRWRRRGCHAGSKPWLPNRKTETFKHTCILSGLNNKGGGAKVGLSGGIERLQSWFILPVTGGGGSIDDGAKKKAWGRDAELIHHAETCRKRADSFILRGTLKLTKSNIQSSSASMQKHKTVYVKLKNMEAEHNSFTDLQIDFESNLHV